MAEELLKSAYEVARDQRLQRNREMMSKLGLVTENASDKDTDHLSSDAESVKRRKRVKKASDDQVPVRRSKRMQGLGPDGQPVELKGAIETSEKIDIGIEEDDLDQVMQLKIARLRALHEQNRTAYKNKTATYEHTWMRVRTMSDKALERRINVIEHALGEHCVVKMRMFAEVLVLAEKFDLASKATEALNRLFSLGLE